MIPLPCILSSLISTVLAVTQQEFFKSVQENVDDTGGVGKALALAGAAGAIVVLLAILSKRSTKQSVPKAVNHQGRLLKEMAKSVGLKRSELRKLKSLADTQNISDPLTLLLCPSLLAKSLNRKA